MGNAPQQRAADQSGRNGSKNRVELKLEIYRSTMLVLVAQVSVTISLDYFKKISELRTLNVEVLKVWH